MSPHSCLQKPEHFVDKIAPLPSSTSFHTQDLVVFLVTPSFASWLRDDEIFVKKALQKLYTHLPGLSEPLPAVKAVCAVVDRLPEARAAAAGGDSGHDAVLGEFEHRAQQPPITETGYEGIAYVVLPGTARLTAQPRITGHLGCIDFLAHTHTSSEGRHYDRVRVPLANTVFQTGEPSTMTTSTWQCIRKDGSFKKRNQNQKKTMVVNLSAEKAQGRPLMQSHLPREAPVLSIPLLPLTVPREVDGHMGNIIRGIIGPNGAKMTASTELEQVVPRFFKARGEPAQATSAWALVVSKDNAQIVNEDTRRLVFNNLGASPESMSPDDYSVQEQQGFEALWQQQPPRWNAMIQEALRRGARLHKVLSGGGGWGKKAGLLSLDPMPVGAPARDSPPAKDGMADDFDSVDEFSTALKPVVEDGDSIQFFISAVPTQAKDDAAAFKHLKKAEENIGGHAWSWEFGVVPSTVDSIPGGSWQHTGEASEEMVVFKGSFGALTEGGLTLMDVITIDRKAGIAEKDLNTTMVDVPFSRWSAVRLLPQTGIQTGTVGDSSKKTMPLLKEAMSLLSDKTWPSNNAGTPS